MAEDPITENVEHMWYARPVFFVADIQRAISFYVDQLGFTKSWHEGDAAGTVCQVNRATSEIILCEHDSRRDKSRLFVELTKDGVAELQREIAERSIPHTMAWWGYDSIQIEDPDGNELLVPVNP